MNQAYIGLQRLSLAAVSMIFIFIVLLFLTEMEFFDIRIAKWGFSHEFDNIQSYAQMLSEGANSLYWLVASGFLMLYFCFIKKDKFIASRAKFFFFNIVISGISVNILKVLFGRPRPYVYKNEGIFDFQFFQTNANYFSFPSGHTTTAFSIAMALSLMFPRYAVVFFAYAVVMAYSRVACYVHYLSDVTAGAILGTVCTLVLYKYKRIFFIKNKDFKLSRKLSIA